MAGVSFCATPREIADLNQAIARSCTCGVGLRCSACRMLETDQRAVNGLIYARRMLLARLLDSEFDPAAPFNLRRTSED